MPFENIRSFKIACESFNKPPEGCNINQPTNFDLITIDKSWVDILLRVPALPAHDQKIVGELLGRYPGGAGGNVACAASRLGLRTGLVSWVGDDLDGALVLADLRRFGVDTTQVLVKPGTATNYTFGLIDPSGEKAIVIVPTTFDTLLIDPPLRAYLSSARLVYTTPYDLDQLERTATVVHAAGGLMATDIEPVAALLDEALKYLLSLVDIAFINSDALNHSNYKQAAQELRAAGPRLVVITCGARGALACAAHEVIQAPAFGLPVTDTTGAGDCFTAAFLAAYLRQRPLEQTLRYAQAAAVLSIQAYGARGALPDQAQVQALIAS